MADEKKEVPTRTPEGEPKLSRRDFLRLAAETAAVFGLGGLAAACQKTDAATPPSEKPASQEKKVPIERQTVDVETEVDRLPPTVSAQEQEQVVQEEKVEEIPITVKEPKKEVVEEKETLATPTPTEAKEALPTPTPKTETLPTPQPTVRPAATITPEKLVENLVPQMKREAVIVPIGDRAVPPYGFDSYPIEAGNFLAAEVAREEKENLVDIYVGQGEEVQRTVWLIAVNEEGQPIINEKSDRAEVLAHFVPCAPLEVTEEETGEKLEMEWDAGKFLFCSSQASNGQKAFFCPWIKLPLDWQGGEGAKPWPYEPHLLLVDEATPLEGEVEQAPKLVVIDGELKVKEELKTPVIEWLGSNEDVEFNPETGQLEFKVKNEVGDWVLVEEKTRQIFLPPELPELTPEEKEAKRREENREELLKWFKKAVREDLRACLPPDPEIIKKALVVIAENDLDRFPIDNLTVYRGKLPPENPQSAVEWAREIKIEMVEEDGRYYLDFVRKILTIQEIIGEELGENLAKSNGKIISIDFHWKDSIISFLGDYKKDHGIDFKQEELDVIYSGIMAMLIVKEAITGEHERKHPRVYPGHAILDIGFAVGRLLADKKETEGEKEIAEFLVTLYDKWQLAEEITK